MDHNIKSEITEDGILIARIDMPGRTMNVFSLDMMDSLERLINHVAGTATVRGVVLTSAKQTFLAGADLDMIRMFTERAQTDSHEQLHDLCGRLGRLFRRIEKSSKPYVAAINGLALGGGLEVSLSCHARILADGKGIFVGLPEIKLGLLPGAGGTQRLPRMIGVQRGLQYLLSGDSFSPRQALEYGVVDKVVSPDELLPVALQCAREMQNPIAPWDKPGAKFESAPFNFSQPAVRQDIAKTLDLSDALLNKYPAYNAIIDCVIGGWNKPMDEAWHQEMDIFVRLIQNPVAGNMVRTLFLNRQRAAKLAPAKMDARTTRVAVLGERATVIQDLLASGKATVITAPELDSEDIAVITNSAQVSKGIPVAWLGNHDNAAQMLATTGARAAVWLSQTTAQGCALEVLVPQPDVQAADAGILLGRWARATVLQTQGSRLLLPHLQSVQDALRKAGGSEADELLAIALAAADVWGDGGIADVGLADVAVVIAGLHPTYSGGPFTYLRQVGVDRLAVLAASAVTRMPDVDMFRLPSSLNVLVAQSTKTA